MAADTRRCEQAVDAQNEAKELLRTQTNKLLDVEAEVERMRQDHKSKLAAIQTEMNSHASKASSLMNELEAKDRKMSSYERRIKSVLEERDDIQKQFSECNRIRSRMEERNSQLQTQVDATEDALCTDLVSVPSTTFWFWLSRLLRSMYLLIFTMVQQL